MGGGGEIECHILWSVDLELLCYICVLNSTSFFFYSLTILIAPLSSLGLLKCTLTVDPTSGFGLPHLLI